MRHKRAPRLPSLSVQGSYPTVHLPRLEGRRGEVEAAKPSVPAAPALVEDAPGLSLEAELSQSEIDSDGGAHIVYAMLSFKAARLDGTTAPPSDFAIVLDVSGSMDQQSKLENATSGAQTALDGLGPEDRCAVVIFAESAKVVVPSGSKPTANLLGLVRSTFVQPGTMIRAGIEAALPELKRGDSPGAIQQILLVTDGVTENQSGCLASCLAAGDAGVKISTVGLGSDVNAAFLQTVANATGGTYTFASKAGDLWPVFESTLRMAQQPVLRQVSLDLQLADGVELRHAFFLRPRRRDLGSPAVENGHISLQLGDLRDQESVSALVELFVPANGKGTLLRARLKQKGLDIGREKIVSVRRARANGPMNARVVDAAESMSRFYARR
jgi:Mg-chelatase subunit ChlD